MRVEDSPVLTPAGFRLGAVAMLDALGFRGIWERVEVAALLNSLRKLVSQTSRDVSDLAKKLGVTRAKVDVRFLSDTVVFGVSHDIPFSTQNLAVKSARGGSMAPIASFSVEVAVAFAAVFQAKAALAPVPLTFRGAIGFGEFLIDGNILVGRAIDEVAKAHQLADGAIVWLLQSAEAELARAQPGYESKSVLSRALLRGVTLPFKDGATRTVSAVNPLSMPNLPRDMRRRLLLPFGKPAAGSDVARKRESTSLFLDQAAKAIAGRLGGE